MDLETIQNMWKKDSVIDQVMLDEASLKIPQLHQKYLELRNEFKLLRKKKSMELRKMNHNRWLYYSGKAAPEEYEEQPFNYKVMKSDVQNWINVDDKVLKLESMLEYYDTILDCLDEILKQVHQMSYNIKNAIAWRTFTGGV